VQCRERWCNVVSPDLKLVPWTKEEDDKLLKCAQEFDRKWSDVAKVMAPRTDNQCWRRWKGLEQQMSPYREYSLRRRKVPVSKADKGKPTLARMLAHPQERTKLLKMYLHENFSINVKNPAAFMNDPVQRMVPPSLPTVTAFQRLLSGLLNFS